MKTYLSSALFAAATVAATLLLAACGSLPASVSPNANNIGTFTVGAEPSYNNITNAFSSDSINVSVLASVYSPPSKNRLTANTGDFLVFYNDGRINSTTAITSYDVWRGQLGAASGINIATYTIGVQPTTTISVSPSGVTVSSTVSTTLALIANIASVGTRAAVFALSNTLAGVAYTVPVTLVNGANTQTINAISYASRGRYLFTLASSVQFNVGYMRHLQTVTVSVAATNVISTVGNAVSTVTYAATSFAATLTAATINVQRSLNGGYRAGMYTHTNINRLFIWADYAAIGLDIGATIGATTGINERVSYFGALTPVSALPATTNTSLSYTIGEAWGTYTRNDESQSELLRGDGSIIANFASNILTLSLDVNTFSGADVFDVNNVQLSLDRPINQFNLLSSQSATVINYAPGYTNDLINDVNGIQTNGSGGISGSFFGPSGSDVGGAILHVHGDGNGRTNLGFVGKQ